MNSQYQRAMVQERGAVFKRQPSLSLSLCGAVCCWYYIRVREAFSRAIRMKTLKWLRRYIVGGGVAQ